MIEYFLDQGIIVGYAGFIFNESEALIQTIERFGKICVEFIEINKQENFITCFYIAEVDLLKFKKRRKIILEEVKKKLQNPAYEIGSSEEAIKNLYKGDINKAKRIFSLAGLMSEKELRRLLIKIDAVFSIRLDYIFKSIISKIVVPVENIDKKLVNILREFIDDFSDCNVFASILQYADAVKIKSEIESLMMLKKKVIFVTLDNKHFNENNISFIKQDARLKSYSFPEVRVLI